MRRASAEACLSFLHRMQKEETERRRRIGQRGRRKCLTLNGIRTQSFASGLGGSAVRDEPRTLGTCKRLGAKIPRKRNRKSKLSLEKNYCAFALTQKRIFEPLTTKLLWKQFLNKYVTPRCSLTNLPNTLR